jgi:hypothetical protein
MSHDLYASWATVEISRMIKASPLVMLAQGVNSNNLNIFANRESGRKWPIPDGRISAETQANKFEIAIELKRTNEGLHGILTAIGQAQAYIHKGYSGAAIVIPNKYDSHPKPGDYITDVINNTRTDLPIGVFIYDNPDTNNSSPFFNKLTCLRQIGLSTQQKVQSGNFLLSQKSSTQWAHLREGSTESFAFYKYLQCAKQQNAIVPSEPKINLAPGLVSAVLRIGKGVNPINYLSFSSGQSLHDIIWRNFWFNNVLTNAVSKIWHLNGKLYSVNNSPTELLLSDGTYQVFFSSKSDSIKNKIIKQLNDGIISENEAWEIFAKNIHDRAHSYREDIDSGLEHLGLIDSDGKPSDNGYKFVDACERTNDCHSGKPWLILGSSILQEGSLAAFLHYIYKVSEKKFKTDPLAFTSIDKKKELQFDQKAYLLFLRNELANTLHVMNTATVRGGATRQPFQGEFAILRKFDFVSKFRIGVGLEINWPLVQEFLEFEI